MNRSFVVARRPNRLGGRPQKHYDLHPLASVSKELRKAGCTEGATASGKPRLSLRDSALRSLDRLVSPTVAAELLGVEVSELHLLRKVGLGPSFVGRGTKVRYRLRAIFEFKDRESARSLTTARTSPTQGEK